MFEWLAVALTLSSVVAKGNRPPLFLSFSFLRFVFSEADFLFLCFFPSVCFCSFRRLYNHCFKCAEREESGRESLSHHHKPTSSPFLIETMRANSLKKKLPLCFNYCSSLLTSSRPSLEVCESKQTNKQKRSSELMASPEGRRVVSVGGSGSCTTTKERNRVVDDLIRLTLTKRVSSAVYESTKRGRGCD